MPVLPGEVSLLSLYDWDLIWTSNSTLLTRYSYADVHYFFSPPNSKPVTHHRFDKRSYVYLYHDALKRKGRLEVANHAGTPDQDAFSGCTFSYPASNLCRCWPEQILIRPTLNTPTNTLHYSPLPYKVAFSQIQTLLPVHSMIFHNGICQHRTCATRENTCFNCTP